MKSIHHLVVLNHACFNTAELERRLLGSIYINLVKSCLDSTEIFLGISNKPRHALLNVSFSLEPLKGKYPANITNSMIPRAHISAFLPQQFFRKMISGLIQLGVPQNCLFAVSTYCENPKSIILILLFKSMSIFSTLRSPWNICFLCI